LSGALLATPSPSCFSVTGDINKKVKCNILYVSILCVLYIYIYLLRFSFNTLILGYKIHWLHVSVASTIFGPFWYLPTKN
jgi:hypothetical protein